MVKIWIKFNKGKKSLMVFKVGMHEKIKFWDNRVQSK